MKKTFLARRNALLSSVNVTCGTFALVVVVFLLLLRIFAPNFFWNMFRPVFGAADIVSLKSRAFFDGFADASKLALQNEKLRSENAALANENQMLYKKVESLSGFHKDIRGIVAGVIAKPPESPYDTLVISAGSEEGVSPGMKVFGEGGVPIGNITSVVDNFSRVTLFSAPNMTINGWVGSANLPLIIKGAGAGAMNASVARSAEITKGDTVFAPGPGMLPIGTVIRVDDDNRSSSSVTLRIMPALNLFSITWVVIRDADAVFPYATSTLP